MTNEQWVKTLKCRLFQTPKDVEPLTPGLLGAYTGGVFLCGRCLTRLWLEGGPISKRTEGVRMMPIDIIISPEAIDAECNLCEAKVVEEWSQAPPVEKCVSCGGPKPVRCYRCRHRWTPRGPLSPGVCPNCNSPSWGVPRRDKSSE